MIIGVGTNVDFKSIWQSPDLPSLTITTAPGKKNGSGWIMTVWYQTDNPNEFTTGKRYGIENPCVAIMASGMGGDWLERWHFRSDDKIDERFEKSEAMKSEKPLYQIPTMAEIREIPWNGFRVASTFSGAGGSCTGYRMAGYRVEWANEFVPIAQASYKANSDPGCFLDPRDIKTIQPEEILERIGLAKGELDLFDGSPPRQAFSTAGKREKGWGKEKSYEHGAKQCNETLFDEYIRLLRGLMPKVFVAENVSGLVKGMAKGFFLEILKALKGCGYRVKCQILDAKWLGVPQSRQRTIFIGVREDLGLEPVFPKPFPYFYSVRDALPHIVAFQEMAGFSGHPYRSSDNPSQAIIRTGSFNCEANIEIQSGARPKEYVDSNLSSPAIMAVRSTEMRSGTEKRRFTIDEIKSICSFPADFILKGTFSQQWERLGNSVPPLMMRRISEVIRDEILLKLPK